MTRTEEGGGREGCVSETACICRWDASALQIKAERREARERKRAPISRGEGIVELGNCPLPRNFAKVASNSLARCLQFLAPSFNVMNVSETRLLFFSSRPANLATSERTWTWTGSAQGKRILEAVTLKKRAREGFIYKKAALKRRGKASYVKLRKLRWNFPPLSLFLTMRGTVTKRNSFLELLIGLGGATRQALNRAETKLKNVPPLGR